MALVTQCIVHRRQYWCSTSNRKRGLNYLAILIRWSASVIKVSERTCSDIFERRLDFSFTVIISELLLKSFINKALARVLNQFKL